MPVRHRERHRTEHLGWLSAAVLGANDGILALTGRHRTGRPRA
jgi:vacuolar iron transporter family protein